MVQLHLLLQEWQVESSTFRDSARVVADRCRTFGDEAACENAAGLSLANLLNRWQAMASLSDLQNAGAPTQYIAATRLSRLARDIAQAVNDTDGDPSPFLALCHELFIDSTRYRLVPRAETLQKVEAADVAVMHRGMCSTEASTRWMTKTAAARAAGVSLERIRGWFIRRRNPLRAKLEGATWLVDLDDVLREIANKATRAADAKLHAKLHASHTLAHRRTRGTRQRRAGR